MLPSSSLSYCGGLAVASNPTKMLTWSPSSNRQGERIGATKLMDQDRKEDHSPIAVIEQTQLGKI